MVKLDLAVLSTAGQNRHMRDYTVTLPKDADGQPKRFFRANMENNVAKAVDQLSGLCAGILADGVVSDEEARFFADWIKRYLPLGPVWPFSDVLARVERIFADGRCDDEERAELKAVMEALCGHTEAASASEAHSTTLPLCEPQPSLVFPERQFVITGKFAYGTRTKVMDAIVGLGGVPTDSAPSLKSHYLIIGTFSSRDWINTSHGRKIERAVELRQGGSGIAIVSEEHWRGSVHAIA